MEVLSPPAQFATPLSPALFNERISTGSFSVPSPSPSTPPPMPKTVAPSPGYTGHSLRFTRASSPKKLALEGFLPLPTITASPICAPTSTFPSFLESPRSSDEGISAQGGELARSEYVDQSEDGTPPNSSLSLRILFATPPTWISTPPTPPQKQIRRPAACGSRKPPSPVSPSASFPASTSPHATPTSSENQMKRCTSYPTMSPRSRAISESALTFELPRISHLSEPFNDKKSYQHRRSKAIFHFPSDEPSGERGPSIVGQSPASSSDGHELATDLRKQGVKDAVRIFHALQELLTTEMDYVRDLRLLFTGYIQRLSSFEVRTSTFARASASFATGPWTNTYIIPQNSQNLVPADGISPSSSSSLLRPVFSDSEIEILTRNLKDILRIQEGFMSTLKNLLSPLGLSGTADSVMSPVYDSEDASMLMSVLKAVAEKFVKEASIFEVYQTFCAGHPEAVSLIRKIMSQHPSEWEVFERRCSVVVSRLNSLEGNSLISTSDSTRTNLDMRNDIVPEQHGRRATPTASPGSKSPTRWTKEADHTPRNRESKLVFMDYLIKPVQRICKYPLLLDRLKSGSSPFNSDEVTIAIENAAQAMRNVAASVDEARRTRETIAKSSMIISRFVLPLPSPSLDPSSPAALIFPLHTLTPFFLSSLGPCILAGSLDVMYYSPRRSFGDLPSITAKYLGAFLYSGYLILAKINKGRKYEPRHWFSLADFEIAGVEGDEAMLPCSFRLSARDINFELAAACQREKDIWLRVILDSTTQETTWKNTPLPSYKMVGRGNRSFDSRIDGSPTPGGSDTEPSEQSFRVDSLRRKLTLRKSDAATFQDQSHPPSRRSSAASIKSIFAPMGHDPNSICINRSLTSGRLQVDHDLEDVASQVCLSARLYARLHDEELFPQPPSYRGRSGFSRSNSAISVAGLAKNRLSKQESLRVPRRRARCDSITAFGVVPQPEMTVSTLPSRRHGKRLSLQSLPPRPPDMVDLPGPSPASSNSTFSTQFPSHNPTAISTPFPAGNSPLSRSVSPLSSEHRRSRVSLVRNMKDFFHIGPAQSSPRSSFHIRSDNVDRSSPLLRKWRNSVSRRRSRSAPYDEDLPHIPK